MTSRYPLAFIVFAVAAGLVCLRLGSWQLDRLAARRLQTAESLQRRALAAAEVRTLGDSGSDRRATASGRYDFDREIVLRGRGRGGVPGVEVVTPLLLGGSDTAVLVVRGYVPSADAISYDATLHREEAAAAVSGIARAVPVDPAGAAPLDRNGARTWRRLDLRTLRDSLPYAVLPLYIIADSPATASPAPLRSAAPRLDDGPHLNYAIQWFGFAAIAFGGAAALWIRRRRDAQVPGAG